VKATLKSQDKFALLTRRENFREK